MIGTKMQEAINEQIKLEMESSYLYLSMATFFYARNLDGMAQWMRAQTNEEMQHAMKLFNHLVERGGKVQLSGLANPKKEWNSPLEAFEEAYQHELFITGKINSLVKLAREEDDNPAAIMLQWFVNEQVEEEASVSKIVETMKMIGTSGSGLVMLDHKLGKRQ